MALGGHFLTDVIFAGVLTAFTVGFSRTVIPLAPDAVERRDDREGYSCYPIEMRQPMRAVSQWLLPARPPPRPVESDLHPCGAGACRADRDSHRWPACLGGRSVYGRSAVLGVVARTRIRLLLQATAVGLDHRRDRPVCGSGEACVRVASLLMHFVTALLVYAIAEDLYDSERGLVRTGLRSRDGRDLLGAHHLDRRSAVLLLGVGAAGVRQAAPGRAGAGA